MGSNSMPNSFSRAEALDSFVVQLCGARMYKHKLNNRKKED
jgi:hypothetical protein